jgi:hypothetical protein
MMQNGTKDLVTPQRLETTTYNEQSPPPIGEVPLTKILSYVPLRASRSHRTFPVPFLLPQRGFSSALITGAIAGVLSALLTILIVLINTGTFYAAHLQIAVDKLTVKTALALAALELLTFVLSLLIGFVTGFVVGRIAVRHRLGFLAGACAGAISSLIVFLVSLLPSYPGNLIMNGASLTRAGLVISVLLLCLWSLGGGLVGLFGTWVATVRHPYYLRPRG